MKPKARICPACNKSYISMERTKCDDTKTLEQYYHSKKTWCIKKTCYVNRIDQITNHSAKPGSISYKCGWKVQVRREDKTVEDRDMPTLGDALMECEKLKGGGSVFELIIVRRRITFQKNGRVIIRDVDDGEAVLDGGDKFYNNAIKFIESLSEEAEK